MNAEAEVSAKVDSREENPEDSVSVNRSEEVIAVHPVVSEETPATGNQKDVQAEVIAEAEVPIAVHPEEDVNSVQVATSN